MYIKHILILLFIPPNSCHIFSLSRSTCTVLTLFTKEDLSEKMFCPVYNNRCESFYIYCMYIIHIITGTHTRTHKIEGGGGFVRLTKFEISSTEREGNVFFVRVCKRFLARIYFKKVTFLNFSHSLFLGRGLMIKGGGAFISSLCTRL